MKHFFLLCLFGSCSLAAAQTNAPGSKPPDQQVEITSDSGLFDGIMQRMIYQGHVFVTDNLRAKLHCGQLTVDLPPGGGHPTNIVAETDVVIDYLDGKGQTNTVTANKAIYAYSVVNLVTNETVTFTGGKPLPQVESPQFIMRGEPLILDVVRKSFECPPGDNHYKMIIKHASSSGTGTNASPFNFLK